MTKTEKRIAEQREDEAKRKAANVNLNRAILTLTAIAESNSILTQEEYKKLKKIINSTINLYFSINTP